jgi:type I site-specific restriction-modification system R (restriction) subunit
MPIVTKYLTQKDSDVHRAQYTKRFDPVDDVSHLFGWAYETAFFFTCDGWCEFLDSVFPDYFPFGTAQNLLISVVRFVYENRSEHNYNCGVSMGLQIVKKVNQTIDWAKNEIQSQVNAMRDKIDREIVAPLRDRINAEIKPALDAAQKDIDTFRSNVSTFNADLSKMKTDVSAVTSKVDSAAQKAQKVESDLTEKARQLDTQLKGIENRMGNINSLISSLDSRVKALEGKPSSSGIEIPKEIEKIFRG